MHLTRFILLSLYCVATLTQSIESSADENKFIRFATYNIAMGLESHGKLLARLKSGDDEGLRKAAAVIQKVRPDVLLINEFDFQPEQNAGQLFVENYLAVSQHGSNPISYAHMLDGPVNTGVDSGLDLDNDGETGGPADAWGFGWFPGQYGMQVLSRFPINKDSLRSFRGFLWQDMPGALQTLNPDGSSWYPDEVYKQMRLSSKSHWDIPVQVGDEVIHFLVSHPTPPVFDGPEDRNGLRNHDEIRLWADYLDPNSSHYIYDDNGVNGGLNEGAHFVIAGDLNADPVDGDSSSAAILQLLDHPLIDSSCTPSSDGSREALETQGGKNLEHRGDPSTDTGDFNDRYTGNMRIDYVLPSVTLEVNDCGVFWPSGGQPGHELIGFSDHRLVWMDVRIW